MNLATWAYLVIGLGWTVAWLAAGWCLAHWEMGWLERRRRAHLLKGEILKR